jgi:hypothetical protein
MSRFGVTRRAAVHLLTRDGGPAHRRQHRQAGGAAAAGGVTAHSAQQRQNDLSSMENTHSDIIQL